MNLLTSEDKTLDLPMVVAEWNKKIPQKNIRWSTDAMQVYLDKYSMKILVICIQPKLKTAVQYSQMK